MKKALDQTVRTMKREVNKKVLKAPEIERKVLEATCNEPWGPHGTLMADIAHATRNFNEYQMIMSILWKRLNDSGKNWRHVFKSLTVMEFLVGHGAERFIDDLREHTYQIQTLVDFQYIDSSGRDQGLNVRRKAQSLVALINDKEKIREYRQKAASNRDKYRSSGMYRASSYSSTGGNYGDREEDGGRYSSDDRSSRDRDDRYSRDRDDRYDDRYRDGDRYGDDNRYGSRNGDGYDERDRDRADRDRAGFDDARSSGSKDEDDWRADRKQPPRSRPSPPSYEEVSSPADVKINGGVVPQPEEPVAPKPPPAVHADGSPIDEFDPRGGMHVSSSAQVLAGQGAKKLESTLTAPPAFMNGVEELFADTTPTASSSTEVADTNPFGTVEFHAAGDGFSDKSPSSAFESTGESHDLQALAIVLSDTPQVTEPPPPPPQPAPLQPQQSQSLQQPHAFTPFPPQQHQAAPPFPPQQHQAAPVQSFPPQYQASLPGQPGFAPVQSFPLQHQGSLPGQSIPLQHQASLPGQGFPLQHLPGPLQHQTSLPLFQQQFQQAQAFPPAPGFHPAPGFPQQQTQQNFPPQQQQQVPQQHFPPQQQTLQQNFQSQPPQQFQPVTQQPQPLAPQQQQQTSFHTNAKQQEKFQPKSAVWADTLSSGLVNLNIGPLKHDPLAELGIHISESKVSASQNRKEEKTVASANRGKAMGSGTGLGMVGASIMSRAPPPPPPIMMGGMGVAPGGMGMGGGMGGMPPPMMNAGPMMRPPGMPMMNGMGMGMGGYANQYNGYR